MTRPAAPGLALALHLAGLGWHILPLSFWDKTPLRNCPRCRDDNGRTLHAPDGCPCIPAGRWCHGVRAATTDPERLAAWWRTAPHAVPGVAAGPSRLVLIDIDTHGEPLPAEHATALLPGIDLRTEPIDQAHWADRDAFRDGRDSLGLLARLRGKTDPWPVGERHQPVVADTPSGGVHLWYRAPEDVQLHQALSGNRRALAWKVDVKAGWSYGLAPGATTTAGTYRHRAGNPASPGSMTDWLTPEVIRVAGPEVREPAAPRSPLATVGASRATRYLETVLNRGIDELRGLREGQGRERTLMHLAYQIGGLIDQADIPEHTILGHLIDAGTAAGLTHRIATRAASRSLANGRRRPLNIRNN
jgi:hypothetical protein